jgi:ubiquinone/menaquinone biosynthesis C-methylase UbiE
VPHKFDPTRMAVLMSEERHRRQPPEDLLRAVGVGPGSRLADIGCGPGFYALPAARMVGAAGRVFALDVQPAMVARVREAATAQGLENVEAAVSAEDRLPLPDGVADIALLANVLHECADRPALLREVRRVLVPGGRVAVVEWRKEPTGMGPPLEERLSEDDVREALAAAGFGQPAALDAATTGPTHFGLVATRAD